MLSIHDQIHDELTPMTKKNTYALNTPRVVALPFIFMVSNILLFQTQKEGKITVFNTAVRLARIVRQMDGWTDTHTDRQTMPKLLHPLLTRGVITYVPKN